MRACSHVCGVVFNPIDDDFVNVCEECEEAEKGCHEDEADKEATTSFYLGKCGLIIDYLL
ncbi:hypothetical protein [Paenibacillus planticolens]|uniref:Uncharacterized protein n=1 Tax=Paenibacillus planticolens TaxID=2654976 RepID=A0ABX1ZW92_9BACL|nr:hypothetical protein [Paenibacillus planticolens]NOV03078.1 hypothetical protein [Paenibacillus planticolens]